MNLSELIKNRHSVRSFDPKKVDDSLVEKILESARLSPSAKNTQPWKFFIAQSTDAKDKVMKAMAKRNQWAKDAGVIFVILADMNHAYKKENKNYLIDIGLCLENMLLTAEDIGLGACACTGFENDILDKELELPQNLKSVVVVPVGYKKEEPEKHEKNSLQDIVWKKS